MSDYPATLRTELTRYRRHRWPFEKAWTITTQENPCPEEWSPVLTFMRAQFQAAYNRDSSRRGRFILPEPDASAAVRPLPRRFDRPTPVTCRSADGCSKPAMVGRFGPTFCASHGTELAALSLVAYEGIPTRAVA